MSQAWPPAPTGLRLESSQRRTRAVPPILCADTHACQVTAAKFQRAAKYTLASVRLGWRFQSSPISCTRDLLISRGASASPDPGVPELNDRCVSVSIVRLVSGEAQSAESNGQNLTFGTHRLGPESTLCRRSCRVPRIQALLPRSLSGPRICRSTGKKSFDRTAKLDRPDRLNSPQAGSLETGSKSRSIRKPMCSRTNRDLLRIPTNSVRH